jgi:hypothetical protein
MTMDYDYIAKLSRRVLQLETFCYELKLQRDRLAEKVEHQGKLISEIIAIIKEVN